MGPRLTPDQKGEGLADARFKSRSQAHTENVCVQGAGWTTSLFQPNAQLLEDRMTEMEELEAN